MQDERTHGHNATGRHETINGRSLSDETSDAGLQPHTERLRSGKHTPWHLVISPSRRNITEGRRRVTAPVGGAYAEVIPDLIDRQFHAGTSQRSRSGNAAS